MLLGELEVAGRVVVEQLGCRLAVRPGCRLAAVLAAVAVRIGVVVEALAVEGIVVAGIAVVDTAVLVEHAVVDTAVEGTVVAEHTAEVDSVGVVVQHNVAAAAGLPLWWCAKELSAILQRLKQAYVVDDMATWWRGS